MSSSLTIKDGIERAVCDVLLDVCGGEDAKDPRRLAILDVSKSSVSFPNKKSKGNSNMDGKPHDIEIRAALTLFHRFRRQGPNDTTAGQSGEKLVLKVVSSLGLERSFASPRCFAEALCPLLEERCSRKGLCHHVEPSSSGIICIVTPQRGEALRKLGRLPCPQCIQWCKGEKGLWWHQQQMHSIEHSIATASAAKQRTVLALIPYTQKTAEQQTHLLAAVANANTAEEDLAQPPNIHDPLEYIKNGDIGAVKNFVKKGYDPSDTFDRRGASPLMWAAGGGHLELCKYLVQECHCSPNQPQRGKRSFSGRTPLHWAARNGHLVVVKYLVDECHTTLEAATTDGTTAFCWACWQAHEKVMKFLYDKGANIHITNSFGCNAVLWCAQGKGGAGSMEWLNSIGCDVKLTNSNGHGVLHKAAQRGYREIVEWMFDHVLSSFPDARVTNLEALQLVLKLVGPDGDGCSPSDLAGMEEHEDLAEWIASKEIMLVQRVLNGYRNGQVAASILPLWLSANNNNDSFVFSKGQQLVWEPWGGVSRMRACFSEFLP